MQKVADARQINECPCFSLNMNCTDLCNSKSCSNVNTDEDAETTEDDYENFDDDDWDDMIDDKEDLLDNNETFCLYQEAILFCYKDTHALFNKI